MLEKSIDLSSLVDIDVGTSYGGLNVVLECCILIFVGCYFCTARYHDEQGEKVVRNDFKT